MSNVEHEPVSASTKTAGYVVATATTPIGPTFLVRAGLVCLVVGILAWGLAIAGGIMLSTGVVLRWLDERAERDA